MTRIDTSSSKRTHRPTARLAKIAHLPADQLLDAQQQVLELVAAGAPLADTLGAISRFAEDTMPKMMASVLVFNPETHALHKGGYGRKLRPDFQAAIDGMKPGPSSGSCGTAAFRSQRVICRDVQTDPLWTPFRPFAAEHGIASAWSTPLLDRDGNLLGVFGMYYPDCREPSPEDLELVDHFAHLAAIAVERHRNDTERDRRGSRDHLTGLGNRKGLGEFAAALAQRPSAREEVRSLALLDVDHFNLTNDLLGQQKADGLLRQVSVRLAAALGGARLLVRFGGDQFVVLMSEPPETARPIIDSALRGFAAPVQTEDTSASVSLSAGLVAWDPASTPLDEALSQALDALDVAKRLGRDRCEMFGESERAKSMHRGEVARRLRESLDNDGIEPYLQPIVRLADERPVGFELLARLRAPHAGIGPAVFVPVAEQSNLILEIGSRVLEFACRTLREHEAALRGLTFSVNMSAHELLRDGGVARAQAVTQAHGVRPDRIVLEVTESEVIDPGNRAHRALLGLKDAGFRLALDDFGTGYSSLGRLLSIPFDHIKIDRSLTAQLTRNDRGRRLCDAALTMAQACGTQVTAEGVESTDQAMELASMGYHLGQGYLWAKPMPLFDALAWLRRQGRAGSASAAA